MRLESARVQNYKLIQDTGEFRIDDLTCLVGKNESGKTAVLRALHRLNPDDPDEREFDVETEYPRHQLFDYKPRHGEQPDVVIATSWALDDDEATWVEETFGSGVLTGRQVTVTKGYDNRSRWDLPLDEARAVANLVADSGLDAVDAKKLAGITTGPDLIRQVQGLDASTRQESFLERLTELLGTGTILQAALKRFEADLPTFVYYSNYHALPGQMSLEQFVQLEQQEQLRWPEKIFRALLSLVGSSAQDISQTQTYEALKADLEAIGLRR